MTLIQPNIVKEGCSQMISPDRFKKMFVYIQEMLVLFIEFVLISIDNRIRIRIYNSFIQPKE